MRYKIIVVIRTGENILNHGDRVMLGVTANNDNGDDSNNENQEEQLRKKLQKESLTPLPFS
jgi:hypothetical protein